LTTKIVLRVFEVKKLELYITSLNVHKTPYVEVLTANVDVSENMRNLR